MKVLVTAVIPSALQWRGSVEGFCLNVDPSDNNWSTDIDSLLAVRWAIKGEKEAKALLATLVSSREPLFANIDPDEFLSARETGILPGFLSRVRDSLLHEIKSISEPTL